MKFFVFIIILTPLYLFSQNVSIGTIPADPSAKLDIQSTTSGVLIPRLTTTERNAVSSPASGLLVFNSDNMVFEFYNGTNWSPIANNIFENLNGLIKQKTGFEHDFIIGKEALPLIGEIVKDTFFFFDHAKAAFRGGTLNESSNWSPENLGQFSFGYGLDVQSSGRSATAFGNNTNASGDNSTAMGSGTFATGVNAVAMGRSTSAPSYSEIVVGLNNTTYSPVSVDSWRFQDRLFVIGNGINGGNKASNAMVVKKSGDVSFPYANFLIGKEEVPTLEEMVTDTFVFYDKLKGAFRGGNLDNSANWSPIYIGLSSFGYGLNISAAGNYSTSMGNGTSATGENSIAIGENTIASGLSSTAIGSGTQSSGNYSTAMGASTIASGLFSIAKGLGSTASGYASTATGFNSIASGNVSSAMGVENEASSYVETVLGLYNSTYTPSSTTTWFATDRLFVIGNGTASISRSDALVVLKNGNTGIGNSTPSEKLHVQGNICYTGNIGACSDLRYKLNFTPITSALNKVKQLNGLYYYWNQDQFPEKEFSNERQIGVIAQEVEALFPEMVLTDSEGYKSVDYSRLTPVLIEAVKELSKQNESLDQQLLTNKNILNEVNAKFQLELENLKRMVIEIAEKNENN